MTALTEKIQSADGAALRLALTRLLGTHFTRHLRHPRPWIMNWRLLRQSNLLIFYRMRFLNMTCLRATNAKARNLLY